MKILDHHDIAAALVLLGIEKRMSIRRNRHSGHIHLGPPGWTKYLACLTGCKAEEFNYRMPFYCRGEIDSTIHNAPISPESSLVVSNHWRLRAAFRGDPPYTRDTTSFQVIKICSVARFKSFKASLPGDLYRASSSCRHLPYLHTSAAS